MASFRDEMRKDPQAEIKILEPFRTNIEYDSNSGCLTFKPLLWKS